MSKVTIDVAKEETSQSILGKVNQIDSKIVPNDLSKVLIGIVDFKNDDIEVIHGGINSDAGEITTS